MAPIPHFDDDDLERSFEERFLDRGWRYFNQGMVRSVHEQDGLLFGQVKGSGHSAYVVSARLEETPFGLQVQGNCSCPVHYNCKHVAAILYHHMAHRVERSPARGGSALSQFSRIWLERLRLASIPLPEPSSPDRILYLLRPRAMAWGGALEVVGVVTRPLKTGGFGKPRPFNQGSRSSAGYVTELDRALFSRLEQMRDFPGEPLLLRGGGGGQLLRDVIATGRCHWDDKGSPPLTWGEPLESALSWREGEGGAQHITLEADERLVPLPILPPAYYDPRCGCCGALVTGLPDEVAEALAAAPEIPAAEAEALSDELLAIVPWAPRPEVAQRVERDDVEPVGCLRLYSENLNPPGMPEEWIECAELHFEYEGHAVHPLEEAPISIRRDGHVEVILRRREWELDTLAMLANIGLIADYSIDDGTSAILEATEQAGEWAWRDLITELLPGMREEGWRITIEPSFRLRMVEPDDWYGDVEEGADGGWFDLELGVEVEGRRLNLLPLLVNELAAPKGMERLRELDDDGFLLVPLDDGGVVRVPASRLRHLADVLIELHDDDPLDEGRLRLNRLHAPRLLELGEGEAIRWSGEKKLRQYGRKLADFQGIKAVKPPRGLKAELRPYQQDGLNWLQFLRQYELGGILADDMGLGKTVQTLAHLLKEREARRADRPSLVIAPTTLMVNWGREAARFAPSLKVLTFHGPERKAHFDTIGDHDLVLTTYPLLARDVEVLAAHPYHLLVLDEAQQIKNPKAKAWQAARALRARHRLALTGTPMENHLGELWSLFDQLLPGLLGESKRFTKLFRTPIEKRGDGERHHALRRRVAPFMLRREKREVVTDLPPKSEILSEVELDGGQRDLYETIRVSMLKRVREEIARKGLARSHITILDALLKLRQVCCDPRLLKIDKAKKVKESAKLSQLMELLPEMVEEGRRILLFSQFTSMLGLIEAELKRRKLDYVKLTGQTRDRATPVDRFQAGEVPIFLISLKAGGAGLNLTAADTVIHYDPWWNPAVERQATDRAHRIGQERPLFVYKLIARGTVEERIAEMQARKQGLADALFAEGGKGASALTGEELRELFEPL